MWRRRRRKRSRKRAGRRGDRSGRKKEGERERRLRRREGRGGGGQDLFPRSEPARTLDTICVAPSTIIVWTEKYAHEAPWVISDVSRARRKRQYTVCVGREARRIPEREDANRWGEGEGGKDSCSLPRGAHIGASPWTTTTREPRGPRHSRVESGGGLFTESAHRERGSFRCPAARADPALR